MRPARLRGRLQLGDIAEPPWEQSAMINRRQFVYAGAATAALLGAARGAHAATYQT